MLDGDRLIADLKEKEHQKAFRLMDLIYLIQLYLIPRYAPDYYDIMGYYLMSKN